MAEDKFQVNKFNGQDYAVWKVEVSAYLAAKDLDDALTTSKSEDPDFVVRDKKARSYLLRALDIKHGRLVLGCKTANQIWERLSSIYEQKSFSSKIVAQTSFFDAKMDSSEKIADYISRIEYLAGQLADLGEPVADSTLVGKIVSGLTQSYSSFMSSWLSTSPEDMTLKNLLPRLLAEEAIKNKFDGEVSTALVAQSRRGKPDRTRGDGQKSTGIVKNIEELKKRTKCRKCGRLGHWKRECPSNSQPKQNSSQNNEEEDVIVAEANLSEITDGWIVDSGATEHMCPDDSYFVNYRKLDTPKIIRYGNNGHGYGIGVGDIHTVATLDNGHDRKLIITNVLHVPDLRRKLISVSAITKRGNVGEFSDNQFTITSPSNRQIMIAHRDGNLYRAAIREVISEANTVITNDSLTLWHERLGHVNRRVIEQMVKFGSARDMPHKLTKEPISPRSTINCISCSLGKQQHKPFRSSTRERAKSVGERIHADLCGPIGTETFSGNRYFVLFKDEYSNYRHVYFVKTKDQVFQAVQRCIADIEADVKTHVRRLVTDKGSELISNKIKEFLLSRGVSQEFSSPHVPQQNGFIERENRTVVEAARSMLFHRKLPEQLWGEAVNTAVYILNRVPNKNTGMASPYELYFKSKPRLSHVRVFGSLAIAKEKHKKRSGYQSKLEPRGRKTILVGYERDYTFRLYDPETKKVMVTPHVEVDERLSIGGVQCSLENLSEFLQSMPNTVGVCERDDSSDEDYHTDSEPPDSQHTEEYEQVGGFDQDQADDDLYELPPSGESAESDERDESSGSINELAVVPVASNSPQCQDTAQTPSYESQLPTNNRGVRAMSAPTSGNTRNCVTPPCSARATAPPRVAKQVQQRDGLRPRRSQPNYKEQRICAKFTTSKDDADIAEALLAYGDEPASYEEAIQATDAKHWVRAMDDEISSLNKNKTWRLVQLPSGRKPISSKWVYKIKRCTDGSIERYKARLVVRGFSQRAGFDYKETFSPVVRLDSIRIILAIAAEEDLELVHFDVRTAFLHGTLQEDIYMVQPQGYETPGNFVCKLQKSLYGLKQAPRAWNTCFVQFLERFDLVPLKKDSCILVRRSKQDRVILMIALFVDDGLAASNNMTLLDQVISHLKSRFEISVMDPTCFVGIQIYRDRANRKLTINQSYYIQRVVERFNLKNAKPVSTPAEVNLKLTSTGTPNGDDSKCVSVPYREAIGSLLYAALATRPDIAHIVSYLARFSSDPRQCHWSAVKRVIRYLSFTPTHGITYGPGGNKLSCYSDADYGNCPDTRKSITGFMVMLNDAPVAWKSTKQANVANSTTVAEFVAASTACVDVLWARQLLSELGRKQARPTEIFVDNQGAVKLVVNQQVHSKTKHIDIQFMFVRDAYNSGHVDVKDIAGNDQLADMLTKPMSRDRLKRLCEMANIRPYPSCTVSGSVGVSTAQLAG